MVERKPSCSHGHTALSRASCRHAGGTLPIALDRLSGVRKRPMIRAMSSTARPQQRFDHRLRHLVHRSRDVTLATDIGVATRGSEAAATHPEAHCATSARAGSATNLWGSPHRRTPAGRTRQDTDPARRGSGRVPPIASGFAVPTCVAESVPCLAPTAAGVCPRRSVLVSPHITVSTDAPRGPGDQGHG